MSFRILVVDPEPFFGAALAHALGQFEEVSACESTTDEREAQRLCTVSRPDVVATELSLDRGSGLRLIGRLREDTAVVALTREPLGDVLLDAVDAGAAGCIGHGIGIGELVSLLSRAASGHFAVDPDDVVDALRQISAARRREPGPPGGSSVAALTTREREIFRLVARGLRDEEIGRRLYLSAHTVRTHVGNILRKLDVHSRAELARFALSAGETRAKLQISQIRGPELPS